MMQRFTYLCSLIYMDNAPVFVRTSLHDLLVQSSPGIPGAARQRADHESF